MRRGEGPLASGTLSDPPRWVGGDDFALLTDLYELTMLQAYWRERMEEEAAFSLYFRTLPAGRNYMLACGLGDALRCLEHLRFTAEHLAFLDTLGYFRPDFLAWLAAFRFTGDVFALPEGTAVFAEEPLLEVVAPLPQAQLAETLVMNQVGFQTVLASKCARVVTAAAGRPVVDFGLRRMHGADAGLKAARAFHVAGAAATSNLLAGLVYGVRVAGTMAHSYVQAHEDELAALRAFARLYPETTLLVDTYGTLEGVRKVAALAAELGAEFRVRAVRLDSGDLGQLAKESRTILDAAGLQEVEIFASGGLDEWVIADLLAVGAPIDGFGVGTRMGVSADAPYLDLAYKLTAYAGKGRLKTAAGKRILPGRKQIFRREADGEAVGDVIARAEEDLPGRPLLVPVMRRGRSLAGDATDPDASRERAGREIGALPARVRGLAPADPPYPVEVSGALREYAREVEAERAR